MTSDSVGLRNEAQSFTHFLAHRMPTDEVVEKYCRAHTSNLAYSRGNRFDAWMVRTARTGSTLTWLLDSYSRLLRPRGLLRHKLILTYAILETTDPFFELLERSPQRTPLAALLALTRILALAFIGLMGGLVLAFPVHLLFLVLPRKDS